MRAAVGMMTIPNNFLPMAAMTPMERRAGRFLRAPDHDAGTGGAASEQSGADLAADAAAQGDHAAAADNETLLGGAAPEKPADGEKKPEGEDGADGKKADEPAIITGAPEKYEFKLGEGVALDQEAFDLVEPILRELNLNQDAAGKMVGVYAEKVLPLLQQRAEQQASSAGEELRADWARTTMADRELGGVKLEESKAMAARAMSKFLPNNQEGQAFRTFLNESGLGNHPEMMRILSRIGRELGEAQVDAGNGGGRPLTTEEKFYGRKG